jgi:hypothetical protein
LDRQTLYSLTLAATASDDMDKELARYIVNHFDGLLADKEKLGLKQLRHQYKIDHADNKNDTERKIQLYKKIGWLTDDKEVLELVQGGQDVLDQKIANRIMSEHADKVFINNCPSCGQLARTPQAKQCRHCGHSWR